MKTLYATPLSHFSRKVRILLDLYGESYQIVDIGNVAQSDPALFGAHPLMKVPALVDEDHWIIESDHIAQYLVDQLDPEDRYRVHERDWARLNARAVMNGVMQEEVKSILGKRTGIPVEEYSFFAKSKQSVRQGLEWMEEHAEVFSQENPGYLEFHLLCLWEHLEYYDFTELKFLRLEKIVNALKPHPVLQKTSPFVLKKKA